MKTILVQSSTLQVFSKYIDPSTNWYESFCMCPDNAINQYVTISKLIMDVFTMGVESIDEWLDLNSKQFIIPIRTLNDMKLIGYIDVLIVYYMRLAHWGRVTHICVNELITIIDSGNGLMPGRRQAIIWTNAGILLIEPLGTNFNDMLIEIHKFSFKKFHFNMSSGKWQPSCLGINVLKPDGYV